MYTVVSVCTLIAVYFFYKNKKIDNTKIIVYGAGFPSFFYYLGHLSKNELLKYETIQGYSSGVLVIICILSDIKLSEVILLANQCIGESNGLKGVKRIENIVRLFIYKILYKFPEEYKSKVEVITTDLKKMRPNIKKLSEVSEDQIGNLIFSSCSVPYITSSRFSRFIDGGLLYWMMPNTISAKTKRFIRNPFKILTESEAYYYYNYSD